MYAKTLNLGGIMVWSVDQDDYTGLFCGHGQFPFLRRIHDILVSSDKRDKQLTSNSTKETKLSTKQRVTFVSVQRFPSKHQKPTSTQSLSKPKILNTSVKNSHSALYLLFIVSFLFNAIKWR